jgi:hypothetical protein
VAVTWNLLGNRSLDVHEVIIAPELRSDERGSYRYVCIAAWGTLARKQANTGIERTIADRTIKADLFNDFRCYYQPQGQRIIQRAGSEKPSAATWTARFRSASTAICSGQRPRATWGTSEGRRLICKLERETPTPMRQTTEVYFPARRRQALLRIQTQQRALDSTVGTGSAV